MPMKFSSKQPEEAKSTLAALVERAQQSLPAGEYPKQSKIATNDLFDLIRVIEQVWPYYEEDVRDLGGVHLPMPENVPALIERAKLAL